MAVVRKFLFDNDFGEAPQSNVGSAKAGAAADRLSPVPLPKRFSGRR